MRLGGVGLALILVFEVGLRLLPVSAPIVSLADDPDTRAFYFAMPRGLEQVFSLEADEGVFRTASSLTRTDDPWVQPQEFPARRGPDDLRIAFLGGSSLQGAAFPVEETFPALAAAALEARFPGRRMEVINLGSGHANTRQLGRIAAQLGPLRPDVLVIHAGHNDAGYVAFHEVLLTASAARRAPLRRAAERSAIFRSVRRFREGRWGKTADRGVFGPERDTSQLGVEIPRSVPVLSESVFQIRAKRHDETTPTRYAELVEEHERLLPALFERSLRELVRNARDQGMEVVLAKPASNLRDVAPGVGLHRRPQQVSRRSGKRFDALTRLARERMRRGLVAFSSPLLPFGDPKAIAVCETVLPLVTQAMQISDSHAEPHFLLGTCLMHTDPAAAATSFRTARDLAPAHAPAHRAPSSIEAAIDRVAASAKVPVIDLPTALAAASESGVPGFDLFLDNVHLNGAGHRAAAAAVADALAELRCVKFGTPDRPSDPSPAEFIAQRKAAARAATKVAQQPPPPRFVEPPPRFVEPPPKLSEAELRAGNLGEDPPAPLPDVDRSANVGEVEFPPAEELPAAVETPTPAPQEPSPAPEQEGTPPETDRSGNLGEDDYGDPSTNQGEGDEGPVPSD